MKKIIISLSNRDGCSKVITEQISENIKCEHLVVKNYNIKNCIGCLACHNKPQCVLNDNMSEIYEKLLNNDLLVFVTPNYFDGLSGFAKNFFDRLHPFYTFPKLKDKKVIFIFIGGGKVDGTLIEMQNSIRGIVKYLKFDNIKNFALQSLNISDLTKERDKIDFIIKYIDMF